MLEHVLNFRIIATLSYTYLVIFAFRWTVPCGCLCERSVLKGLIFSLVLWWSRRNSNKSYFSSQKTSLTQPLNTDTSLLPTVCSVPDWKKALRDGPLENLCGGGGAGRSTKKIFAQGKIKFKKIHARQLILKKYLCYGLLWPKKKFIQGIW